MAHTPGPWEQHSEYPDRIVVNGSCVYEVRDMTTEDGTPCVFDVALMAAAPEMLSVLRTALNELVCLYEEVYSDDESDNDTTAAIDAILDVIAKAERSA
jgi:hypothetical protein